MDGMDVVYNPSKALVMYAFCRQVVDNSVNNGCIRISFEQEIVSESILINDVILFINIFWKVSPITITLACLRWRWYVTGIRITKDLLTSLMYYLLQTIGLDANLSANLWLPLAIIAKKSFLGVSFCCADPSRDIRIHLEWWLWCLPSHRDISKAVL